MSAVLAMLGAASAWLLQGTASLSRGQPAPLDVNLSSDLISHLSPGASVFTPGSSKFDKATTRWNRWSAPNITMVVEVATEKDVQLTVQYANQHDLPFLAVDGAHGATLALAQVHHGIQIWMHKLNSIDIAPDGKTATMGGGLVSELVVDTLYAAGKYTVTGLCECTGMLGPMLGGGHGWLQGRYGLSADNLVQARVVLANGSAVDVSSTSNPDLFWALRGAGHNFGIVTRFQYKIYDVPDKDWNLETFNFSGDKVERVFEQVNKLLNVSKEQSDFINFSFMIKNPDIDPDNAILTYFSVYHGPPGEARKLGAPFHKIGPLSVTSQVATYPELAGLTYNGNSDPACQTGSSAQRFPADLKRYNLPAIRAVYDKLNNMLKSEPALANSFVLLEGYSVKAVQAVPADSTAFPDRYNNLLVSPVFIYAPNKTLDGVVRKAGTEMRDMLVSGSESGKLDAYVNYAIGDETLEELYGHEPWRVPRLKALKKEYDPRGRFNFYAPIS